MLVKTRAHNLQSISVLPVERRASPPGHLESGEGWARLSTV